MIDLDLTAEERAAYLETLEASHRVALQVEVLNRNEEVLHALTAPVQLVVDGAVQYDASADVTRSCNLSVLDPLHRLQLDPTSPAQGALYADNFLQVRYGVYVASLPRWVWVPVFRGPLVGVQRSGAIVALEAQGKEALALGQHRANVAFRLRKGWKVMAAVREAMGHAGERRFRLPELGLRLSSTINVPAQAELWRVVKGGATDANGEPVPSLMRRAGHRQAYYNGRGQLVVRMAGGNPVQSWREGVNTGEPSITYDAKEFANRVVVVGDKPKGAQRRARGVASLPAAHPMSASALARNGVPRRLTIWLEVPGLKTDKDCRERAEAELRVRSVEGLDAQFECLPVPHLEELDRCVLVTDSGERVEFPLRSWTLPLTASGGLMSVGFHKAVRPRRPK